MAPILIVDDEPIVRQLVSTLLHRAGFATVVTGDGVAALEELSRRNGDFALVLTDVRMPRMDGIELAKAVASQYPAIPVVLMSGYAFDPIASSRLGYRLSKPFTSDALLSAVHRALGVGERV